jgi:hypothetical protein
MVVGVQHAVPLFPLPHPTPFGVRFAIVIH